jgi:starch synthase (maltosyl-transferring)
MIEARTAAAGPEHSRPVDGRRRVIIDRVSPEIDGGRFPIKRSVGQPVTVTVDMFADGHDAIAGVVKYRHLPSGSSRKPQDQMNGPQAEGPVASGFSRKDAWDEVPLEDVGNDTWRATFIVNELGVYEYTVEGWIDRFESWRHALLIKADAGQDVSSELLEGAEIVHNAAAVANGDGLRLLEFADKLKGILPLRARVSAARSPELRRLMRSRPDRGAASRYERVLTIDVDSPLATFGAWYEMFPRSCTTDPLRSGTFREAEARLPELAAMGFDVVYLPPIHPIGTTHRKGPNNALQAKPGDPGSPWAIGAREGGHTAVDPGLGTIDDFDHFVGVARRLGLEVALDIAFQASPDHPWVREHPEWFRHRPDGTIKYAENPPKKYQDIYPLNFESDQWEPLWNELLGVLRFWLAHGVRVFRVDNPHTKSFPFWTWAIAEIRRDRPDTIFLAEAFTRPKVMRYLAKAGFNQSYTYFTWRNSAQELREYLTELTVTELVEYMRPNFFANTPDILHEYLQRGGRPAFQIRLLLAATLSASYGIYSGYELCEATPVRPGSEEYLDSEKYQIRPRDWAQPGISELIARVNAIRREQPALQNNVSLQFHATDNPHFLFFSKNTTTHDPRLTTHDSVFVAATVDPQWKQEGWVQMPIWELGISPRDSYTVEDLLDGARYQWRGEWNYVKFEPDQRVAHIFRVLRA